MTTDLIRYDLLVQDALKGVVRRVLTDTVRDGLPGDHHFYVSFRTGQPGVKISARLRERYPEEMTIVLQHQFDGLNVTDAAFEVGLSFSGIPERLRVPFDALTGFFDPSVQFGLKFEIADDEAEKEAGGAGAVPLPIPSSPNGPEKAGTASKSGARRLEAVRDGEGAPATKKAGRKEKAAAEESAEESGAEVVSLDAFRKKS